MSFQLLTFLCGVAKFFGITPANVKDRYDSGVRKCYVVFMFLLLTLGVLINTYYREFYRHYVHIKVVVCFLNDICFYGLNFSTIIGQTFWKRQLWNDLIKHLKKSGCMTQVIEKSDRKLPYYFGFVLANIFHIVATITIGYWSYNVKGIKYFEQETAEVVQIYLAFMFKFVLCVITNMILSRYKGLKTLISNHLEQQQTQNRLKFPIDDLPMHFIQKNEYTMCFLKKTVDIYNEMFGWPMFFLISYTTLNILNNIDYAIFQTQHPTVLYTIFYNIGVTTWDFVNIYNYIIYKFIYSNCLFVVSDCDINCNLRCCSAGI